MDTVAKGAKKERTTICFSCIGGLYGSRAARQKTQQELPVFYLMFETRCVFIVFYCFIYRFDLQGGLFFVVLIHIVAREKKEKDCQNKMEEENSTNVVVLPTTRNCKSLFLQEPESFVRRHFFIYIYMGNSTLFSRKSSLPYTPHTLDVLIHSSTAEFLVYRCDGTVPS